MKSEKTLSQKNKYKDYRKAKRTKTKYDFTISYIVPVFNDEDVLNELYGRLFSIAEYLSDPYEIIFIEDGSQDNS
jgi:hypothetical protein